MVAKDIKNVTIVNPSCKYSCNHCGYPSYSKVNSENIKNFIKILQDSGKTVKLYDMDITTDSLDLFQLTGQYDNPKGFGWMNVTESFNPTDEQLSQLEKMTVGFCLSLHGSTPEINSILTGSTKRHEQILKKYNQLRNLLPDKPIGLAMVIHSENIHNIQDMAQIGKDMNVSFLEFINILYAGSAPHKLGKEHFLSKNDLKNALMEIKKASEYSFFEILLDSTWGPTDHILAPPTIIPEANYRNCSMFAPALQDKFCNAGYNHVVIRADNLSIFPCPGMSFYEELKIGELIENKIKIDNEWHKQVISSEPCNPCEDYENCKGGCRISAITEGIRKFGQIKKDIGQYNCAKYVTRK